MKMFVIERTIPGAGDLTQEELREIARKSCDAIKSLNTEYNWVHSYVTDEKFYCIHEAPNAEAIIEHARKGGFPADKVSEVKTIINSKTGRE